LNQNDPGIQESLRFYAEALVEDNPEMGFNDTEIVLRGRFEESVTVFTQELKDILTEPIDTTPPGIAQGPFEEDENRRAFSKSFEGSCVASKQEKTQIGSAKFELDGNPSRGVYFLSIYAPYLDE
jgi:hypothetical protein